MPTPSASSSLPPPTLPPTVPPNVSLPSDPPADHPPEPGPADLPGSERTTFGLRPPRHRVDPRCRGWWATQIIVFFSVPILTLAVVGLLIAPARWWLLGPALGLLVIAIPLVLIVPPVRWRVHRWEVTDQAVYSRSGFWWREWRAAPLSRVQTVDLDRGPLQRRFGLATVSVTTASSRGAVHIKALDAEQATDLVHRLTHLTEADAQDAT
ncbi:PH domain-containing protein [Granulicoccus phenolivorans]|uniref:PH domain-containing protein n=1 Tax=Granulicoccus phenolivorans TaxID=266854 RepID=UPI0003FE61BD|nr:PH domain-containing protein [Granulicoccus phenolivorans]